MTQPDRYDFYRLNPFDILGFTDARGYRRLTREEMMVSLIEQNLANPEVLQFVLAHLLSTYDASQSEWLADLTTLDTMGTPPKNG